MKKVMVVLGAALVAAVLNVSAWAADPVAPAAPGAMAPAGMAPDATHPCKAVEEACKAAGFVKGGAATGKGIFRDCIEPLMKGQAVAGVSVPADVLQACIAKIEARKNAKH